MLICDLISYWPNLREIDKPALFIKYFSVNPLSANFTKWSNTLKQLRN